MEEDKKLEDISGVGSKTAEKLIDAGYENLMAVAVAPTMKLAEDTDLSENKARKIISNARNNLDMGFASAKEVKEEVGERGRITTGSEEVDELLGGGIPTKAITEFYGDFGSGKCVAKGTKMFYYNDKDPYFGKIATVYQNYREIYGERKFDNGWIVPLENVEVMGYKDNRFQRVKARAIYKEPVKNLLRITTEKGREVSITASHKLLVFRENRLKWINSEDLRTGDYIACPRSIEKEGKRKITKNDARFLGFFVAEGTSNPPSISTSNKNALNWLKSYLEERFKFEPTVREDSKKDKVNYEVLLKEPVKKLLGNLFGKKAGEKFVPEVIFNSDIQIVKEFLAAYLEGDGYPGKDLEFSTKSERLATNLAYLFLRLGVQVNKRKEKKIKGETYQRLSVCGGDRDKIGKLPFKFRNFEVSHSVNSHYGYPAEVAEFIHEVFKKTLGGNKGNARKRFGKREIKKKSITLYDLLRGNYHAKVFGDSLLKEVLELFKEGLDHLKNLKEAAEELKSLSTEEFKEFTQDIPFPYRPLGEEFGLSDSAMGNYTYRGLPVQKKPKFVEKLRNLIIKKLKKRIKILKNGIGVLEEVRNFSWDRVEDIQLERYRDYVYDFVVPDGHTFIGGDLPTLFHNTQLGFQLSVNVQLPKEKGGTGGQAVFVDNENTFSPKRVVQIAKAQGLDPDEVLSNIKVARAFSTDHQMLLTDKIPELVEKEDLNLDLVVIDSLTGLFRAEYVGRGSLADRQQKLNRHIHELQRVADRFNSAIYVTNQVMAQPDVFFGNPTKAVGGHILAHGSAYRIYLRKSKGDKRIARLVASPDLPEGEAVFKIKGEGIVD